MKNSWISFWKPPGIQYFFAKLSVFIGTNVMKVCKKTYKELSKQDIKAMQLSM
jgi:hypothetical protein